MTDTAPSRMLGPAAPPRRVTHFGHLRIEYDDDVLRPRPWTVRQSLWAADLLRQSPPGPVLELCSGAGQIGLLAVAASGRRLVCVDVDARACELARLNARNAGMADRVEVVQGDLRCTDDLDQTFAMVLADPPYLRSADTGCFPDDPVRAIDGGPDGMRLVWPCLDAVRHRMSPRGTSLLQLRNVEQVQQVVDAVDARGDLCASEWRTFACGVVVRLEHR